MPKRVPEVVAKSGSCALEPYYHSKTRRLDATQPVKAVGFCRLPYLGKAIP